MRIAFTFPLLLGYMMVSALTVSPREAWSSSPKVRIVGYINASSGCQAETVKYLETYEKRHSRESSLEIIDFGSEAGFARWRGDGYSCETIVINGANQFHIGVGQKAHIVVFKMPEGVRWTFEDLAAVLQQELKSPRSSILSDAEAARIARRTPVTSRRTRSKGKEVGEVVVAAQTVFRFTSSLKGRSAAHRASRSASALKQLYAKGLQASEVRVKLHTGGGKAVGLIVARNEEIATVTSTEAEIIRRTPVQTAQFWAFNLREALRMLGR